MSVPIFLNTDHILQKCKEQETGVLLIIAPTGTGKTMGMRSLIIQYPDLFRRTIMTQPTNMAKKSVLGINTMTAQQLIHHHLRRGGFDCDTLVIDEVHTLCVEYHTILSIIQRTLCYTRMRIILMSATPNVGDLENFFPVRVHTVPVSHPFPIEIQYEPIGGLYGFPSYRHMLKHVWLILQKHPDHKRVLVFLYTHEQCDKMAAQLKDFTQIYNQGKTMALYGGMDKEDFHEWHTFLEKEERFIIFSTNVAETSLTIPNLSLVIDFGVRCVQRNNRIVYNHCPKSNMVQRSGRTGRTCAGVVVRCISGDDFEARPDRDNPEYNWDLMVLLMLRHKHNPSYLLPISINTDTIIRKFKFYQLMDQNNHLDHGLVSFVLKCPLLLKNSCQLYFFLKSNHFTYNPDYVLYIISLGLIDQMENRMTRIYYYSYDIRISRHKFLEKIKRVFADHDDELIIYINIILSCLLNEKPVEFSNAFSLNFRSIRQIASTITRLWHFVNRFIGRDAGGVVWQDLMRDKFNTKIEMDHEKKNKYKIFMLKKAYIGRLRHLYMINPFVPKFLLMNDMIWRPNFIVEYYNCIFSPFSHIHNHNRCIIVLSYDDTDVEKWFDPSNQLADITTLSFSLYTFLPHDMDKFIKDMGVAIKQAVWDMAQFKKKKELVKKKFSKVVDDINEDVAYRPGFYKVETSIQDFFNNLSFFSTKIKSCF